ncbi:MAG: hypothetical protein ACLQAN_06085 [Acidimicrobiales bacterium]
MHRSSERRIKVVLVDDQRAIVNAMTRLLTEQPDIELVGTGRNAKEALRLCIEHEPDVRAGRARDPLSLDQDASSERLVLPVTSALALRCRLSPSSCG